MMKSAQLKQPPVLRTPDLTGYPIKEFMMIDLTQFLDLRSLVTRIVAYLPDVFAALLIFAVFWLGFRILRRPLEAALKRMDVQVAIRHLLIERLLRYTLLLVGVVMAADQLGFNVATALAGLGVVGIALGFAAQDSVANVIAGILIFWDKPFQVGDWIETESEYGQVSEITLRSTRIRTPRNTYVVVPNKRIIDATLENFSQHGALRVDVPLGIAYKENVAQARRVLLEALAGLPALSAEHNTDIVVSDLGDSSVNLLLRVWVDNGDQKPAIRAAVLELAKTALDKAGIQIPFPHLQLFVDNVEDRVWQDLSRLPGFAARTEPGIE